MIPKPFASKLWIACALVWGVGCSASSITKSGKGSSKGGDEEITDEDFDPNSATTKELDVTVKGEQFPEETGKDNDEGPEKGKDLPGYHLADARAVGGRYRRIFPDFRPAYPFVFTIPEQQTLGTLINAGPSAQWNNRRLTSVTQEYVRSLRTVLNTACTQLINKELAALKADAQAASKNTIVTSLDYPTVTGINGFMSKMFGYSIPGGVHRGASEYYSVFKAAMDKYTSDMGGKDAYLKDNYRFLCIAVGQDQRVFLK